MANTKKKNKDVKLSTGKKKTMKKLKFLTREDKIQYVIENSHLVKDSLLNEVSLKKGTLKKDVPIRKTNKLSKHGLVTKRKRHIKYLDSILMSELLIGQPTKHGKKTNSCGDNNNDTDLSDQNNSDGSNSNETGSINESETGDNNVRGNGKLIEISINLNEPLYDGKQTNTKLTQSKNKSNKKDAIVDTTINTNGSITTNDTNITERAAKGMKNKKLKLLQEKSSVNLSNGDLTSNQFQCDHCKVILMSKSSIQRHMLVHLDLKPFSCTLCPNRYFRQRGNWRVHMARNHPKEFEKMKYACKVCKEPFQLLEHLKVHQKVHVSEKLQRYTCVFCEKCFKYESQLKNHEMLHMAPNQYKCSICSLSYESRLLYSNHLKSHSKVHDYSCQFCDKSYLRPSSIARHIRVSHGGMRMQCPVCFKLLKGHLTEHMRTHENERPHECDVCGQKFTQSTQLNVHKRSHTGARPYPCRICKQPFSYSNALMLHIRRHTGEKPFECAMCPQTFSQLPHMKAHMRSIHNKTEFYKCNNCNTFFKLKTLLEAHTEECGEAGNAKKADKANDGMLLSRLRFLLALLFTMIASKEKLNVLGFNKRLIDDILIDSIEAMGLSPCKDTSLATLPRLKDNIMMLLHGTVPKPQMALFVNENKSTEEILELLTDDFNKK